MSAINKVDQVSLLARISLFPNRQITIQPAIGVVAEIRLSAVEQIKLRNAIKRLAAPIFVGRNASKVAIALLQAFDRMSVFEFHGGAALTTG